MGLFIVLYCLFCEFHQLFYFICSIIGAYVFDCFVTVSYGGHNFVRMGDGGFCDVLMAELGGVSEYLTIGGFNVALDSVMVMWTDTSHILNGMPM